MVEPLYLLDQKQVDSFLPPFQHPFPLDPDNPVTVSSLAATLDAITPGHFFTGLSKTPFLAVAIGMIACGQGLATRGGAAAVGARTTTAVVMAIFGVIVISALFTFVYAVAGV